MQASGRGGGDKLSQLRNNDITMAFLFRIRVPYSCTCAIYTDDGEQSLVCFFR